MAEITPSATVLELCNIQPPSQSTAELILPLLHFDISWLFYHPVHRLLFFKLPCSKSHFLQSVVPKIKQSLTLTLYHFLPLAGKIVHPFDSRRPYVRFSSGDSVPLTVAESDLDFAELTGNHPRAADDFYACVPRLAAAEHFSDEFVFPVLALQITLFPDCGVCLGFTNHHAIGDASTIVRFIKAWAAVNYHGCDAAVIEEKSLLPSFDRSTAADPNGLDSFYWNLKKQSPTFKSPQLQFPIGRHRATFVLTGDHVQRLKSHVQKHRPELRVTTFAAACAFAWACLAMAESDSAAEEDEVEYFGFPADCRGRLKPPLPAEYFGNCLRIVTAEATRGVLRGGEGVAAAAESIAAAIQKTVHNEKGILDGMGKSPSAFVKMIGKRPFGVTESPRFDLYSVDYGWGRPEKVESLLIDRGSSMSLCKWRDSEGGLEIGLSRPLKILQAFGAIFEESLNNL